MITVELQSCRVATVVALSKGSVVTALTIDLHIPRMGDAVSIELLHALVRDFS